MLCQKCSGVTEDSSYGAWCSGCGGVVRSDTSMYVRHVATAIGSKQTAKLIYDDSLGAYAIVVTQPIKQFVEIKGEWVQSIRYLTFHGSLDEVLILAQPHLTTDGPAELRPASSATAKELDELGI